MTSSHILFPVCTIGLLGSTFVHADRQILQLSSF